MSKHSIQPGELLAYLNGEQLPHIEQALQESLELQQKLEELREAEMLLQKLVHRVDKFDPLDLVDVVSGNATPEQKLRMAALVRHNPKIREELDALKKEWRALNQKEERSKTLPEFFATPLELALGLRGDQEVERKECTFQVVELKAKITFRFASAVSGDWQLDGYLTQHEEHLPEIKIFLRSNKKRVRSTYTDGEGFFSFSHLSSGIYQLKAYLDQGVIVISDIELKDA